MTRAQGTFGASPKYVTVTITHLARCYDDFTATADALVLPYSIIQLSPVNLRLLTILTQFAAFSLCGCVWLVTGSHPRNFFGRGFRQLLQRQWTKHLRCGRDHGFACFPASAVASRRFFLLPRVCVELKMSTLNKISATLSALLAARVRWQQVKCIIQRKASLECEMRVIERERKAVRENVLQDKVK